MNTTVKTVAMVTTLFRQFAITSRARRNITGKNRFRRNTVCFWNDMGLDTMNGMFGTRSPFQGFGFLRGIVPRALPWAGLDRPVGAEETRALAGLRGGLLLKLLSGELRMPATSGSIRFSA